MYLCMSVCQLSMYLYVSPISLVVEYSPIARETGVQSQVESCQRLQKRYLIPPCLTLSIIRYVSRVKWNNPGKGVAPSPTPQCSSYWKGSFRVTLDYGRKLYWYVSLFPAISGCPYIYIYIYIYIYMKMLVV